MNKKTITVVLAVLTALTILTPMLVTARPADDTEDIMADEEEEEHSGEYHGRLNATTIAQLQVCEANVELMEMCMRCAKLTKHNTVYPQCCGNFDKVREFCYNYVYYRQERGGTATEAPTSK